MSAPTRSPESEEQTIWLAGISWYLQWFSQYFWSHLQCLFHFPLFSFTLGTNSTLEPTKTHWRLCSMIEIHVPDKVSYYMEVKGGVVQGTRFCEAGRCMIEKTVVCKCLVWCIVDMAKRVRPVWPATRLTSNPINSFKNDPFWPVTRFDPRPVWPDPNPTVLPCLPMMSKLRLRCNFYKIFTYSSLLNMLCTLL